jgi:hypothetical protein
MAVLLFPLHQPLRVLPGYLGVEGPPLTGFMPQPATVLRVFGVTRDSTGAVLGNCDVDLLRTRDDFKVDDVMSDANGVYEFRGASPSETYYIVAYKTGAPDVAGTTVNTLVGS